MTMQNAPDNVSFGYVCDDSGHEIWARTPQRLAAVITNHAMWWLPIAEVLSNPSVDGTGVVAQSQRVSADATCASMAAAASGKADLPNRFYVGNRIYVLRIRETF